MKIGFLLPTVFASKTLFPDRIFAPGPLAVDTVNRLVKRGHEVWIFSTPDFQTDGILVPGDIEPFEKKLAYDKLKHAKDEERRIRYDEIWKRSFEISLVAEAYKLAKKEHFDVMHSYHDFLFTPHFIEEVAQIPTIYTLHDPLPPEESFEYHQFEKFASHQYVSISNSQRRSTLPLNFVTTIYHGIWTENFPFEKAPLDYVLFMGRPVPEKGLDFAIQAAILSNNKLEIGTHFPGAEKDTQYYKKNIEPYLGNSLISEPGIVESDAKLRLYSQAKALLFPIQWEEPFGMVMIEAMACGTPVIAFKRGSVAEVVKDGVTGFVVDPDRGVEGLVEAIKRIDQIDRTVCRKHVAENFSVEKMVDGYEKVYQKILSEKSVS